MPPKLVSDMSAEDLEEYMMWLEYQKPMPMGIAQDADGIWLTCGRCGKKLLKSGELPKYCSGCGQRVKRGDKDE